MEALMNKLTTYEIFTNLFPGVLFYYFLDFLVEVENKVVDILFILFLSYFLGMFLSRIGSLVIETLFDKLKIIDKAKYEDYVKAELKEKECKTSLFALVEKSNIYRTLIATFLLMFVIYLFLYIINKSGNLLLLCSFLVFVFVFSLSYKKQVKYIKERVRILLI